MPDIEITDQLDKPIEKVNVNLSQPCSLVNYLKAELLHLAVFPDFLAKKDSPLSQAAPSSIRFQAKAQHKFQLGSSRPEIDITPDAHAAIRANAGQGSNLFEGDPFRAPASVPARTGYVSALFEGSLSLGISGSEGDLSFGFDSSAGVSLEYMKAFPLGPGEPTLIEALAQTLSSYAIPANLTDLASLGVNDIATVSGQGSLKISGGVRFSMSPNPLASVDLPLGAGTAAVKAGATAGISASFNLSGSYQMRARRKDTETFELSFLRQAGSAWKADLSGSMGISASVLGTELIAVLLGAISSDPAGDKELLADLKPDEIRTITQAIKDGANHSLQASLDVVLSALADDQAAFQYEIHPAQLSPAAAEAVGRALKGDLCLLTAMEDGVGDGGRLAPGVRMLNSVLSKTRSAGCTLKINLLGILNFLTVSELIRHGEILTAAGDVTIKETVTGNRIAVISDPLARNKALHKAMFDSVLVTTSYRAGNAIALPELTSEQVHFAMDRNANQEIMGHYLSWFMALQLLTAEEKASALRNFAGGGPGTCILRTSFRDADCDRMFFDENGHPRAEAYYLEIGRTAMRALLDPEHNQNDVLRFRLLGDALWSTALTKGPTVNLGPLVDLETNDPRVGYLIGDVEVIMEWAEAMVAAGMLVRNVRTFVGQADLATLYRNSDFRQRCDALQKKLADVVKKSKMRFEEPWGMVCLFRAGGSPPTAYARAAGPGLVLERGAAPALAAAGAP